MRTKRDGKIGALAKGTSGRTTGTGIGVHRRPDARLTAEELRRHDTGGSMGRDRRYVDKRNNPRSVASTCWCERKVVWIMPDQVGVSTESCGRPSCGPPP